MQISHFKIKASPGQKLIHREEPQTTQPGSGGWVQRNWLIKQLSLETTLVE